MGPMKAYRAAADRRMDRAESPEHRRINLTAGQHILHLLLTLITFGLWSPVWIIRAMRGNPAPETPYYR
jgi:hypothetical protein